MKHDLRRYKVHHAPRHITGRHGPRTDKWAPQKMKTNTISRSPRMRATSPRERIGMIKWLLDKLRRREGN